MCAVIGILAMYFSTWLFFIYIPLFLAAVLLGIVALTQNRIAGGVGLLLVTTMLPLFMSRGSDPVSQHREEVAQGSKNGNSSGSEASPVIDATGGESPRNQVSSVEPSDPAKSDSAGLPGVPDMRPSSKSNAETRTHWDSAGRLSFEYPASWKLMEGQDQIILSSAANEMMVEFDYGTAGVSPKSYGFEDNAEGACRVFLMDAVKNGRRTSGPTKLSISGVTDAAWATWEWNSSITELVVLHIGGAYRKLQLRYPPANARLRPAALIALQTLRVNARHPQFAMNHASRNFSQSPQALPQSGTADEGYVAPGAAGPLAIVSGKARIAFDISTCNRWTYKEQRGYGTGGFTKQAGDQWIELKNGSRYAVFREIERTNDAVVLYDTTRQMWIRLRETDAAWSQDRKTWTPLPITLEPVIENTSALAQRPSNEAEANRKSPGDAPRIIGIVLANDPSPSQTAGAAEPDGVELALDALTGGTYLGRKPPKPNAPSERRGVRINSVVPGTPADDAGLWAGAVIAKADGRAIKQGADFLQVTAQKAAGDEIVLQLAGDVEPNFCQAELDYRRGLISSVLDDLILPQPSERLPKPKNEIRVKVVSMPSSLPTDRSKEEYEAIKVISDRGGLLLNEDLLLAGSPVSAIELNGRQVSDDDFRRFRGLRNLTAIRIKSGFPNETFSGSGLRALSKLPRLRTLHFVDGNVDSTLLKAISELPSVAVLSVARCKLSPGATGEIGALTSLRTLSLRETLVTDDDLKGVALLTRLQSLDLVGTKITTTGLAHLKPLTDLECLDLAGLPITDDAIQHLAGFTKLRFLKLSNTRITDQGLTHLGNLSSLESLELDFTGGDASVRAGDITLDALRRSLSSLPSLRLLSVQGRQFKPSDVSANLQMANTLPRQLAFGHAFTSPQKLLAELPKTKYPRSGSVGTPKRNATE
ncbi:MAG: PDZ domain-containing protein [Planctomycetales bacterium]|nr:PDZ domain-containing protein [Planctomycetales bacterium]